MLSKEIEMDFEDGQWLTKAEAAVIFEVSERTIENRIKAGNLPSKSDEGKTLVFIKASKLPSKVKEIFPSDSKGFVNAAFTSEGVSKPCEECENLRNELENFRTLLSKEREAHAELRGEMKTITARLSDKDEIIKAKEQAINAANAAVMLMEQQKQTIEADMSKQLTGGQSGEDKKGWLDKILGR